ncbi:MAG TPA: glycosyltransferase family 4 protein [Vicinamibacterales bacterium]|jgi:glycosyltransferase involved in cell wall biosynthesis|nr:glycosyltransferase family 4 protein [Vicinamibacterales bacterium]
MHPKIGLVAPSLDILGGQGVQACALMDCLATEAYEVAFIPINPRFPSRLQWVRRLRGARTALNESLYASSLARLQHVDVVHVFCASYWSFLLAPVPAILAARILGKRVILNYHSGEAEDHLAHWGPLVHPWLRLVDEIVVPSEYLREVFARHGYRVRVIPNVIDTLGLRYRERSPLRPRLLSARNLERHYGVDVILTAFALIKHRYPDATLIVAGYGREERALRRLAAALGVDGISFVGRQEPLEMAALYAGADVFVNASVVDNQPLSVLEAFAAGLPVVSTSTGDLKNMIGRGGHMPVSPRTTTFVRGDSGLIVPCGDPAAIAAAVAALLEDPDSALAMVRRARQKVDAYTWPYVREAWAATYESGV